MDIDQDEMQHVGFFGLFKESFKTIFSLKKLFAQITITFLLPLAFVILAHIIADILDWRIENYGHNENRYYYQRRESSTWIAYWIFKFIYLTFLFLFSLLSTAAIVYTIAIVYTDGDVAFNKVLKTVPRICKRLTLTFLWNYISFYIYNVVAIMVVVIWATTISETTFGYVLYWVLVSLYCIGFIYVTTIWQLASVVTVLESSYGLKAMMKGNELIKGKKLLSWFVFFVLYCIFVGILILFFTFFWNYTFYSRYTFITIIIGLICLFLLMTLFLIGYVAQTRLYLICKSYHCEPIDRVGLSTHLGGYLGQFEHVLKPNKDVELGETQSHL